MMLKCPKCGSDDILEYSNPSGPIWCGDCDFKIEHKEIVDNPFHFHYSASNNKNSYSKIQEFLKIDVLSDPKSDYVKHILYYDCDKWHIAGLKFPDDTLDVLYSANSWDELEKML